MKNKIAIFFLVVINSILIGQQNWQQIVSSTPDYHKAIAQVETLHDQKGRGKGTGYKQFLRRKSNMDVQVGKSGLLENYAWANTLTYRKEKKKAHRQTGRSTHGDWANIGPYDYYVSDAWSTGGNGRVICTAFHPTHNNTWWVGTAAGGLWKTVDNGINWIPMTDDFGSIGISGIVVNQSNPNKIVVLTGDGRAGDSQSIGVMKTDDGGMHWDTTSLTFGANNLIRGMTMVGHPTNSEIIFAGLINLGLHKSIDGGTTFTQVVGGLADTTIFDVEFIPGNPQWMLATSSMGLLRSLDGGDSWFPDGDSDFPAMNGRMDVSVCPSSPSTVYVIFNGSTGINGTYRGCFKSSDYGANFDPAQSTSPNIFGLALDGGDAGDQGWRDMGFTVDPTNHNRMFAGAGNIWKSEDGGVTWGRETYWTRSFASSDPYVHADQQNFYWKGTDTLLVNNDGGVFYTADYGHSWTEVTSGLAIGQFYEIAINGNEYMGGLQDNGTMEGEFTNPQCHQIWGGDGFGCTWSGNTAVRFLSTQQSILRREAGSSLIIWDGFGGFAFWETELEMHQNNSDFLFLDRGNKLFRGHEVAFYVYDFDDLGTDTILSSDEIRGFAQCKSNDDVMYVVNRDTIIKTENLNNSIPTWAIVTYPFAGNAQPYGVEVDPQNPDRVWVIGNSYTAGEKVYFSANGGTSWANISGSLPNIPMRCIEYHDGTNSGIYVGTEIGMYFLGDGFSDWVSFANFLPNTVVADIEIDAGFITIGTHGRGIWRSELFDPCPANLALTPANDPSNPLSIGEQHYSASNTIISTREIKGGLAQIYYSANNYIDMKPGFLAEKKNFLIVKPDGCPE